MRVPGEVAVGQAKVSIRFDGWPEGQVAASTLVLPVVPRPALPEVKVSPEQQRVWSADGYSVHELRYTPDGRKLVVVLHRRLKDGHLFQFRLWDAASGKERCKIFQIDPEPLKSIYTPQLVLSPDSKHLALRYNVVRYAKEGKNYRRENLCPLHLFDLETGYERWHHEVRTDGIGSAFSPDGRTLATGEMSVKETGEGRTLKRDFTGAVSFWDVATGEKKESLPGGPYQIIWSTQYSADGKYLLLGEEHRGKESEYRLLVWDLVGQEIKLQVTSKGSQQSSCSSDGRKLAVCSNAYVADAKVYKRDIRVWDLETGQQQAALPMNPDKGWISNPLWSEDGRYVFLSSTKGRLWRWDPSGVVPLASVDAIDSAPSSKQHELDARAQDAHLRGDLFAFGVSGKLPERTTARVAGRTLAEDYAELPPPEIVLIDLKTMQRRTAFTGHHGRINCLAFSRDGKIIVSGGSDGTVRFWTVPK